MVAVTPATLMAVLMAGILEGVGFPWPGAIVLAGAAVATAADPAAAPTVAVLFVAGYWTGSCVQYLLARTVGDAALAWLPLKYRDKLWQLAATHGQAMVLWTRPLAIGNYVSIPAGIMKMSFAKFSAYTVLGIAPWTIGIVALGWYFGEQFNMEWLDLSKWLAPGAATLGVIFLILAVLKR